MMTINEMAQAYVLKPISDSFIYVRFIQINANCGINSLIKHSEALR